ncbi:MAG: hypothetical protein J6A01_10570 [Proteobacteria bacterium]|nr:hypothetical protein [Pseudomonadota bacterium]
MSENTEQTQKTNHNEVFSLEKTAADHEAIRAAFGLNKPAEKRGMYEQDARKPGIRQFAVLFITLAVVGASIAAWFGFEYLLDKEEEARFIAEHDRKIAEEEARRNRIEYADIAFLDSMPPAVAIAMDDKPLYARSKDGSYTELRARESTWIQNLPIKEDTILKFSFAAEGFKPLSRTVAYYDWFPSNKPGKNPLEKAFKKIVLEPDVSPRIAGCEQLPPILETSGCEWTVVREIAFRERYAEAVKSLVPTEDQQRASLKSILSRNPLLAQAANGFDVATLDTGNPIIAPELPDATKSLLKTLTEHPYGLYGAITIETDMPDTRVFFMSEPLMVVKASGNMAQVKVQPNEPFTFAVYGQGKPIEITQLLSLRLEANDAPNYVTEIAPHQWHCEVPDINTALQIPAPEIPPELNMPEYRHQLCSYSIKISVKFQEIKKIEEEAAKQREKAAAPQPQEKAEQE